MRACVWVLLSAVLLAGCAAPAKKEPEACAAEPWRVTDVGGGVLRQCNGNEWAQSDNGRDITWNDAQAYCAGKGPGWDLPTVAELVSLYSVSAPGVRCRNSRVNSLCNVDSPFRLSGGFFWCNDGSWLTATVVAFIFPYVKSQGVFFSYDVRALCVRRS